MIDDNEYTRVPLNPDNCNNVLDHIFSSGTGFKLKKIGEGGTSLVYEVWDSVNKYFCIVKEYYPAINGGQIEYVRLDDGMIVLKGTEDAISIEKKKQNIRVSYERNMLAAIFSDEDRNGFINGNYVLPLRFGVEPIRVGDTLYSVSECRSGYTLYNRVIDNELSPMKLPEVINLIKQIIAIVRPMLPERGFCHGDLKPENLWIGHDKGSDNEIADKVYIIDFGSCFNYRQYHKRISEAGDDKKAKKDIADELMCDESIGFSSVHYSSRELINLARAKRGYRINSKFTKYINNLLDAMLDIDERTDLYSILKIFYFVLSGGKDYHLNDNMEQIKSKLSNEPGVLNKIEEIMKKNEEGTYMSYNEVIEDFDILESLYNHNAVPQVWIEEVVNGEEFEIDCFDDKLLCSIKKNSVFWKS